MSKDIAVGAVGVQESGAILANSLNKSAAIYNKPSHLIILEKLEKTKNSPKFVTIDKPELLNGFIQAKGIFSTQEEDEIIKNFTNILTSTPKELFLEVWIPSHKIQYIRSLVFKQK